MGFMCFVHAKVRHREVYFEHRTAPRLRIDCEVPAKMMHSLLHSQQSQPAYALRVEARAVVLHVKADLKGLPLQRDLNSASLRVTSHVVQRLLNHAVNARLMLLGKIFRKLRRGDLHAETGALPGFSRLPV